MPDMLLWKVLTPTDYKAIHGRGVVAKWTRGGKLKPPKGGGARHIALGGNDKERFPIKNFLGLPNAARSRHVWTGGHRGGDRSYLLKFDGSPKSRHRGGEWYIGDQRAHRHPAWSPAAGFPTRFRKSDRLVIYVLRSGGHFEPGFVLAGRNTPQGELLRALIGTKDKGVEDMSPAWAKALGHKPGAAMLAAYQKALKQAKKKVTGEIYQPGRTKDARKRIVAEVVRRQGQQGFRKKLLRHYDSRCAITGCDVVEVLQAAHITPYKGPKANAPSNGMLLRADIHTLFDLGLLTVTPKQHKVLVSAAVQSTIYRRLHEKPIKAKNVSISDPALRAHMRIYKP